MTAAAFPRQYIVRFEPLGKSIAVSPGTTLLDAALRLGIGLPTACYGQGECCLCEISIIEGLVSDLTDIEECCIAEGNISKTSRLACYTRILGGVRVRLPQDFDSGALTSD